MKYINIFNTSGDVQTALNNETLLKPYLAYINGTDTYDYNSLNMDYSYLYFTFEAIGSGDISFSSVYGDNYSLSYSLNNSEWSEQLNHFRITVSKGDKLRLKSTTYVKGSQWSRPFEETTAPIIAYGNILSLRYSDDFLNQISPAFIGGWEFQFGFAGITTLNDAENVVIPSNLIVGTENYNGYTFEGMFADCTSLTKAPILPLSTLYYGTYNKMFSGCTNLQYIKCLATNFSGENPTQNWVSGVSQTGTFVKKSGSTWASGTDGIPSGWTVIEE